MFDVAATYAPKHEEAKRLIRKSDCFAPAMGLILELHALTHLSEISGCPAPTYEDEIWEDSNEADFRIMPKRRAFSLAWHIWHLTRIEDIVGNIIIMDAPQVLDENRLARLRATVRDTGNAMSDAEVKEFSDNLNIAALRDYRIAVGRRSREIINRLTPDDLKRKAAPERLERIMAEGGLTEQEGSCWLLEFWGKKTVAGLLLLPLTRHHIMHLNACRKLKAML